MRIGIDIDNTICDTYTYIFPALAQFYNLTVEELKQRKMKNMKNDFKNYDLFALKYYSLIIPKLPLYDGAKEYINKLKEKHEIIFITKRGTLGVEESYNVSSNYLNEKGILFDKLIVNSCDKYEACLKNNINIFIDDSIFNCINVSKIPNIDVLLFDSEYNRENKDFKRVKSWKEIYDYIEKGSNNE